MSKGEKEDQSHRTTEQPPKLTDDMKKKLDEFMSNINWQMVIFTSIVILMIAVTFSGQLWYQTNLNNNLRTEIAENITTMMEDIGELNKSVRELKGQLDALKESRADEMTQLSRRLDEILRVCKSK